MTNEEIDKALNVEARIIEIPEQAPPSLEEQLRGALWSASTYHFATKIVYEHRVAYIISEHVLQSLLDQRSATPEAGQ